MGSFKGRGWIKTFGAGSEHVAPYVAAGAVYRAVGVDVTGGFSASGYWNLERAERGVVSLECIGHDSVSGSDLCAGTDKELQPWNVGAGTELLLSFKKADGRKNGGHGNRGRSVPDFSDGGVGNRGSGLSGAVLAVLVPFLLSNAVYLGLFRVLKRHCSGYVLTAAGICMAGGMLMLKQYLPDLPSAVSSGRQGNRNTRIRSSAGERIRGIKTDGQRGDSRMELRVDRLTKQYGSKLQWTVWILP